MRILLAEDDSFLSQGITLALKHSGYAVDNVASGADADQAIAKSTYDLLILDLGLPQMDGMEVLRRMRQRGQPTPVIILTARDSLADRVAGLDSGANDYLTKPFDLPELEARIRALMRKENWENKMEVVFGNVRFDTASRRVTVNGTPIDLSVREITILELLLKRSGHVINKAEIVEHLASFDDSEPSFNAVEIVMHRLRKKLESSNLNIRTVRGLGYMVDKLE